MSKQTTCLTFPDNGWACEGEILSNGKQKRTLVLEEIKESQLRCTSPEHFVNKKKLKKSDRNNNQNGLIQACNLKEIPLKHDLDLRSAEI